MGAIPIYFGAITSITRISLWLYMVIAIIIPVCSMYGIFTNIYPINEPNVGKYTIHGASGIVNIHFFHGL